MNRILPFVFLLLPFVLFWAYVQFAAGYRERYGHGFYATHWYWVALAGLLSFIACFLIEWGWFDHTTAGRYVPPAVENGKIVPGHFVPAHEAPQSQ